MNTELLINGQFEKGASDPEDVINPTNGELISAIPQASEDQINRICAPVGLNIGAENPPEIALAIMAQVTQSLRRST